MPGTAWGGTDGDRLWYLLHGVDLPEKPTQSRTIGHSHVLSPGKRGLEPVRLTARRLALKAASRLRRKGYRSRLLVLHGKFEDDKSNWRTSVKLPATQDSFVILAALDAIFPRLAAAGRSATAACACAWSASRCARSRRSRASRNRCSAISIRTIRSRAKPARLRSAARWTG